MPNIDRLVPCECPVHLPDGWEARSDGADQGALIAYDATGKQFASVFRASDAASWRGAAALLWARVNPGQTPPRDLWSSGVPYGADS